MSHVNDIGCSDEKYEKLVILAQHEGHEDPLDMLEGYTFGEDCYGICSSPGCENYEKCDPDGGAECEDHGHTIQSALLMAGII